MWNIKPDQETHWNSMVCFDTEETHSCTHNWNLQHTHTAHTIHTTHSSTTTGDTKKSESKLTLNHLNNKSIQNHWKKNTWCHSTNQRKARGLLRKLDFNFLQTGSALITKNSKMLLFCFYNWAKGHCIAMWRTHAHKKTHSASVHSWSLQEFRKK